MIRSLSKVGYRSVYVLWRNMMSYRRFVIPTFIASLIDPLLYLVAMGIGLGSYMGLIDGMPYLNFIAPGLIVSSCMFSATYETTFGSFVRMTVEKVYQSIIVTPVSVEEVVAGEILWGIIRSIFSGTIMLLVLALFGLINSKTVILYPFLWVAVGFVFSSIGIVITSYAPHFDFFTYYIELFITPMFFFSGIFFPLARFPGVVRIISNVLPLTRAVDASREIFYGTLSETLIIDFIYLFIPAFIFFIWSLNSMKKRLIK